MNMGINKNRTMSSITRITLITLFFLVLSECYSPRRALITIGNPQENYGTVTSQQQPDRERNTYSYQSAPETESVTTNRASGSTGVVRFDISYKSILDNETNYKWEPYGDNPTSMLRYIMADQPFGIRLPRIEELTSFFNKVSQELRTNRNGELASQLWLQMDGNYISSSEIITPDNKKLYRGIYWTYSTQRLEYVNLASGDLINIILISQQ